MCTFTGFLAYDSGDDFGDSPFTVQSEVVVNDQGQEAVQLAVNGGPEWGRYRVEGPGAAEGDGCRYLYPTDGRSSYSDHSCVMSLQGAPDGDASYRVSGRGMPSSFFGIPVGDVPESSQQVIVARPYRFLWSEPRGATICAGASCAVIFEHGHLRLEGAAAGAHVEHGGGAGTVIPIDVFALADSAGVHQVLTAPRRESTLSWITTALPSLHRG